MPDAHKSNTEFVTELMDYSPQGAIAQLFIIEAIDRYSQKIAALTDDDLKNGWEHGLISLFAWRDAANHIQKQIKAKYYPGDGK